MQDLLFYFLGGFCLFLSIFCLNIPLSSFTGIYLRLLFAFVYIPGYALYRGGVSYYDGAPVDSRLLWLLLGQIALSSVAAAFVWGCCRPVRVHLVARSGFDFRLVAIATVIFGYTASYFIALHDSIPIFKLFSGEFLEVAANLRFELTHGVTERGLFSYFRPITKDAFFVIFFAFFLIVRTSVIRFILAFMIFIVLLAHLEKAYALFLVLAILTSGTLHVKVRMLREFSIAVALSIAAVAVTYAFFASSLSDAVDYLPQRLVAQVGYAGEQLSLAQGFGPLLARGLNLGFFGELIGVDRIDVSKMAFEALHPTLVAAGISGSSAGLALAEAYMVFGISGVLLFFPVLMVHFYVDMVFRRALTVGELRYSAQRWLVSAYCYLCCFYPLNLLGSMLGIFRIPYGFEPGVFLVFLIALILFRFRALGSYQSRLSGNSQS